VGRPATSGGDSHHGVGAACETVDVGLQPDSRTSTPYPDSDKTAFPGDTVYWLVLILSGVLEAVWATALGRSEGFTRLAPSVVFAVTLLGSMAGLAYAMRGLPIGTAYAVWVGIGAALTAGYAMWAGQEPVSTIRVLLLAGIVGCVIGLKLTH
jgi:quaternary ammonium compound-resistance protein SugE